MTKQEQIEEMAKVIDKTMRNECLLNNNGHCIDCNFIDKNTDEYDCQSLLISTLLYNIGCRIINKDSVVLSREEYEMLANQYKNLDIKYSNLCDNYKLCKDANETLKQNIIIARKETADKIFNDIFALINNANDKSSKIFGNSSDYGKGYKNSVSHFNEHILELAKQYGVEVE